MLGITMRVDNGGTTSYAKALEYHWLLSLDQPHGLVTLYRVT